MTKIILLFLNEDGYPVSQPTELTVPSSGLIHIETETPSSAVCARLEILLGGISIIRITAASIGDYDANFNCQNAISIREGEIFLFNPPKYILSWLSCQSGLLRLKAIITPVDESQAWHVMLSAIEDNQRLLTEKDAEISDIRSAYESIYSSNAWRAIRVYYKLKDIINEIIHSPVNAARRFVKLMYKSLPLPKKMKIKLKNNAISNIGFASALSLSGARPSDMLLRSVMKNFCVSHRQTLPLDLIEPITTPPGSIAVHLHLFYIDLLDEFYQWLSYIPFRFDLYISITDNIERKKVVQAFNQCVNIHNIRIEAVPNIGRDAAPMIAAFGAELSEYDYILHIHSKKSPHLDGAFDWRKYLLTNLLCNETHIRRIFKLFEQYPELGILYPEPHSELPYWTLTTLVNEPEMRRLFGLIHLEYPTDVKYLDFPVGTMFWARGSALKRLLNSDITLESFPPESGQLDGTLSHAIERSLCLIASEAGYVPAQVDIESGQVNIGVGARNLAPYLAAGVPDMVKRLRYYKHISFSVFGTLICSYYENQEELWYDVECELGEPFVRLRKEAEQNTNAGFGAFDIHDVYMAYQHISGKSFSECERLKAREYELLMQSCRPRTSVISVFNQMVASGCDTVIIEDTLWPQEYIKRILEAFGIRGWTSLYLSGGSGLYKSNGRVYNYLINRFKKKDFIHIGNHELDDMQTPNERHIPTFHVMNPHDMMRIGFLDEQYFERCCADPFCLSEIMREMAEAKSNPVLQGLPLQ